MVNRNLFNTNPAMRMPKADVKNRVGSPAYRLSAEDALAQYAITGCFNQTFYCNAQVQLDETIELTRAVTPEFLAKVAVYARRRGHMKEMPALLLAVLSTVDTELLKAVFNQVIDNGPRTGRRSDCFRGCRGAGSTLRGDYPAGPGRERSARVARADPCPCGGRAPPHSDGIRPGWGGLVRSCRDPRPRTRPRHPE